MPRWKMFADLVLTKIPILGSIKIKIPKLVILEIAIMNIKEMREITGQTQKEFADSFGIPLGTLRRWEYGESTPAPYVLKLIAEKLPIKKESMKKIESSNGIYYYDELSKTIIDKKGTRICVNVEINDVNEHNLVIYANALFESYYDAIEKFTRDCTIDKKEGILWG